MRHYNVVKGDLERFLMIKNLKNISHVELTPDLLMDFREFIMNEYKYVEKYSFLYQDKIERDIPRKVRSDNTVVTKLKKLQAFYNELEDKEEMLMCAAFGQPIYKVDKELMYKLFSSKEGLLCYLCRTMIIDINYEQRAYYYSRIKGKRVKL